MLKPAYLEWLKMLEKALELTSCKVHQPQQHNNSRDTVYEESCPDKRLSFFLWLLSCVSLLDQTVSRPDAPKQSEAACLFTLAVLRSRWSCTPTNHILGHASLWSTRHFSFLLLSYLTVWQQTLVISMSNCSTLSTITDITEPMSISPRCVSQPNSQCH